MLSAELTGLTSLNLSAIKTFFFCLTTFYFKTAQLVKQQTNLVTLNLGYNRLNAEGAACIIEAINEGECLQSLQTLDMRVSDLSLSAT